MNHEVTAAMRPVLARIDREAERASPEVVSLLRYLRDHLFAVSFRAENVKLAFGPRGDDLADAFAAELGIRLTDYLQEAQVEIAVRLLVESDLSAATISRYLAYRKPEVLFHAVERYYGLPLKQLRRKARPAGSRGPGLPVAGKIGRSGSRAWPARPPIPKSEWARLRRPVAECLWKSVQPYPLEEQAWLLREKVFFNGPELFDILSEQSREEGRRNRQRGVELAELGVATVEGSAALLGDHYTALHVLALARLGTAHRLCGDLIGAKAEFRRVEIALPQLEEAGSSHEVAEIHLLLGSLRLFERRFPEALDWLDRAIALARQLCNVEVLASSLLQRIALKGYLDQPHAMLPDLTEAQALLESQKQPDRRLLLCVYQNQALALLETGEAMAASSFLTRAQALCDELGYAPHHYQLQWIAGRLADECGDGATAEQRFRQAHIGFLELGDRESAALAALELAVLFHRQDRFAEVVELLSNAVLPVLIELQLSGEALAAVDLLQAAVSGSTVSLAALLNARQALRQPLCAQPAETG